VLFYANSALKSSDYSIFIENITSVLSNKGLENFIVIFKYVDDNVLYTNSLSKNKKYYLFL